MFQRAALFVTLAYFSNFAFADSVRLMKTGDVATMQVHQDLSQAKSQIDILTYIWDPCSVIGKMILEDLTTAVKRGVKVRVIIDAFTHDADLRRNFSAAMAARGITLRYFNVRYMPDPMINRRVHAKMIVVDGKHYYVGGRNIADDYFDMEANNWLDRDVDIEGASAAQAQRGFDMMWNSDMTSSENFGAQPSYAAWSTKCFAQTPRDLQLSTVIATSSAPLLASQKTYSCNSVRAVIDDPHFLDADGDLTLPASGMNDDQYSRKYTSRAAVDFISHAHSLSIENYTYVPEGYVDQALKTLRSRGRKIQVYTNFNMDTGPIQYLKENSVATDNTGSETVYELSNLGSLAFAWSMTPAATPPKWMIHTKAMVSSSSGGAMNNVLVGSFNLDPRSYGTNVESAVVVKNCAPLAKDLKTFMDGLHAVYLKDRSCAACKVKVQVSTEDKIQATIGRQLFFEQSDR